MATEWAEAGVRPSSLMRTSSMEAVREMVALGLGVTILSDMVFRPWSLDGRRIRTVPLAHPIPPMEVGLDLAQGAQARSGRRRVARIPRGFGSAT
jgi:DNA-binding transcriptional LysR family regulator